MLIRSRLVWGWAPTALYGGAVLLPLATIAERPADNSVALVGTGVAVVAVVVLGRSGRLPQLLRIGLGTMAVAAVLSAWGNRPDDAVFALRLASYLGSAAVLVRLGVEERLRVMRAVLVISLALAASIYMTYLGLVDLPLYADAETAGYRVGGTVGHPNFAAYCLALTLLAQLVFASFRGPRWPVSTSFLVGALLLTGSRGAVLSLALAALVALPYWWRKSPVLLLFLCVTLLLPGGVLLQRFASLQQSGGLFGQNAAGWRVGQWQRALILQDDVGLTGLGWSRAQDLLPGALGIHNGYIEVYVELGLLGILGLVFVLAGLWALRGQGGAASGAVLVYVAVANFGDPVILYPPIMYLTLIILVCTSGASSGHHWHRVDDPQITDRGTPSVVR